jgi:hypothetical protein
MMPMSTIPISLLSNRHLMIAPAGVHRVRQYPWSLIPDHIILATHHHPWHI